MFRIVCIDPTKSKGAATASADVSILFWININVKKLDEANDKVVYKPLGSRFSLAFVQAKT